MPLRSINGTLLTDSATEAYVCPADTVVNRVNALFINRHTALRRGLLWIVPSGGSVDDSNLVIGMESGQSQLTPGEDGFFPMNQVLVAGDKIFYAADVAAEIVAKLDLNEVPAVGISVDGFTRTHEVNDDNSGYMPATLGLAYTVPSAAQVLQAELLLHNKHTAPEGFLIKAVPSGEDPGDEEWIIKDATATRWKLQPGETRLVHFEQFWTGDYEIHWQADNASRIITRMSFELIQQ